MVSLWQPIVIPYNRVYVGFRVQGLGFGVYSEDKG